MPVRIVLSQGQSSNKTIAPTVLEALATDRDLFADRGYDARAPSIWSEARRASSYPDLPRPQGSALGGSRLYRQRNLIERFLNKLKPFRRIATRYDKTARNFLAAVLLAATRLWMQFKSTQEAAGGRRALTIVADVKIRKGI